MEDAQQADNKQEEGAPKEKRVEDMTFEEKLVVLKEYSYYKDFKLGMWIDAQDSISCWCQAKVVQVYDYRVKVHFDGWPEKWDEVSRRKK